MRRAPLTMREPLPEGARSVLFKPLKGPEPTTGSRSLKILFLNSYKIIMETLSKLKTLSYPEALLYVQSMKIPPVDAEEQLLRISNMKTTQALVPEPPIQPVRFEDYFKLINPPLGEGAFGAIYKIIQTKEFHGKLLTTPIVAKIIIISGDKREFEESFKREFAILKSVSKEACAEKVGIVCYYDAFPAMIGRTKGAHYRVIIMEFIAGTNMEDYTQKNRNAFRNALKFAPDLSIPNFIKLKIKQPELIDFMIQTANTLNFLHEREIVHRDIKLANIMKTKTGKYVFIDFGFSCFTRFGAYACYANVVGSPGYASPELWRLNEIIAKTGVPTDYFKDVYEKADVWALGICFYEVMYGDFPPEFRGGGLTEFKYAVINEDVVFPLTRSSELRNIVAKMLIRDWTKRAPIKEILADISAYSASVKQ